MSGISIQSAIQNAHLANVGAPAAPPAVVSRQVALHAPGLVRVAVPPREEERVPVRKLAEPLQPSRSLKSTSLAEATAGHELLSSTPPAPFGSPDAAGGVA